MNIRLDFRENGKSYFAAICLFGLLCVGFLAYRKYNPPTPYSYEMAAR